MKKMIYGFLVAVAMLGVAMPAQGAYAAESRIVEGNVDDTCNGSFLGFRPWYKGLAIRDNEGRCTIGKPKDGQLQVFIWMIVLNILADLMAAIGYGALIFVIYGGWLYLRSEGDPGIIAKGKKTLISAIMGVAIALLASIIVNTIIAILNGATG